MSAAVNQIPAMPSEDEVLAYTHDIRKQVIEKITAQGIPGEDPKLLGTLLATVDGMDRQALTRLKIKSEEKVGNQQAAAAGIIAEILSKTNGHKPFEVTPVAGQERKAPELGLDVPPPQLVDGEVSVAAPQGSFDEFQKKMYPEQQQ